VNIIYCNLCGKFMAVWRHMFSVSDGDIYGAFLSQSNGAVITPPGIFEVASSSKDQNYPSVASDETNRYVVVWQDAFSPTDRDILGQYIDTQGNKIEGPFAVANTFDDETHPKVINFLNLKKALAVWQRKTAAGEAVWAADWQIGQSSIKGMEVASYAFWENEAPAAAVGLKFTGAVPIPEVPIIVYVGDSTGDPNEYRRIYGRLLLFEKVFLPILLKN